MRHASRPSSLFAAVSLIALAPSAAAAQLCLGSSSFRTAPVHAAASYQRATNFGFTSNGVGVDVLYGGMHPFVDGGYEHVATTEPGFASDGSNIFTLTGGYQLSTKDSRTQLCPVVEYFHSSVDVGGQGTITANDIEAGAALGQRLRASPSLDLAPFAEALYVSAHVQETGNTGDTSHSDAVGILTLGVGFVFKDRIVVTPNYMHDFGVSQTAGIYGISLSFAFGS